MTTNIILLQNVEFRSIIRIKKENKKIHFKDGGISQESLKKSLIELKGRLIGSYRELSVVKVDVSGESVNCNSHSSLRVSMNGPHVLQI